MDAELTVNMDNAAFEGVNGYELAEILRKLAKKVDGCQLDDGEDFVAKDTNGNTVGRLIISEE